MRKAKVFVAVSGGVDSSVAAALLKQQGFEVVGVHMRCYNVDGCGERDAEDARYAAGVLGIPFYVFDFEKEYKDKVVKYMVDGYKKGITPNPDVMCNREIKFGLFLKKALEMGANFVATGHYARLRHYNPNTRIYPNDTNEFGSFVYNSGHSHYGLLQAKDKNKDQSYFLWTLTQDQLSHCLFPVGKYLKPQVRNLAKKFGLPNAAKKDSQGICFLGQVSLPDFLKQYIRPKAGAIVNDSGKVIGEHDGAHFYTIGQRHGLKFSNKKKATSDKGNTKPFYVAAKDIKKNVIVVSEGENNAALYKKEVQLTNVNFITPITNNQLPISVFARVRYRQPLERAMLNVQCKKRSRSVFHSTCRISLKFDKPVKFVAPGQSAVFYTVGGEMLGGGIIV